MKKANYFKHFNSLRDEERVAQLIMDLGAEGYGLYILLLELLNSTETYRVKKDYKRISFLLRIPNSLDLIAQVVEGYGLFEVCDQELISSKEMDLWMEEYEQKCKTNAENRKKGWEDKKKDLINPNTSDTTVVGPYKHSIPIEENNNRIEKNKIKKITEDERVQGEKVETSFFSYCLNVRNDFPVILFFEYLHFIGKSKFKSAEENRSNFTKYWKTSNSEKSGNDVWQRLYSMARIGFNLSKENSEKQFDLFEKNQKNEQTEAEFYTDFLEQLKNEGFEPVKELKRIAGDYLKF